MSERGERRQLRWSMLLLGVGLMAAIDEIVFHQMLNWHHFYDRSTSDVALFSDGMLHAAELIAIVAGFFLYADVRGRFYSSPAFPWGWFLIGAGAFQVFDGLVNHKLLGLHQVRYDVDILPYDLAWNGFGLLLILAGLFLLRRARTGEHADARRMRSA